MKNFLISGLVDEKYRIKVNLLAISPDHAIKVFQQKYPKAQDIYVIQNLFKKSEISIQKPFPFYKSNHIERSISCRFWQIHFEPLVFGYLSLL